MGFSLANLVIHAMILFRVSGEIMLSRMDVPLFARPWSEPCRDPVKPLTVSAMTKEVGGDGCEEDVDGIVLVK